MRKINAGSGTSTALVLILGLLVALPQIQSLPLDAHEVLVVRSAEEMHTHGDWVVPYFNGEPRLNKPPLNYWITGAVAWVTSSLEHIQPWHGRAASVGAGIGLIFLTVLLGSVLFDRTIGTAAALILVSSAGYMGFTHDARPDLLYAFWCTAGYVAFVSAAKDAGKRLSVLASYSMWGAYAMASLTKGPHLPAFLLVTTAVHLYFTGRDLQLLRSVIRPAGGFIFYLAIALPWWWLLQERLVDASLAQSQLSGALLRPNWREVFSLYYFYRPLELILPWLTLLPATAFTLYRHWREPGVGLLASLIILPAIFLSFGTQHRPFYMLPVLVPMCLLLAKGLIDLAHGKAVRLRTIYERVMLPLHLALIGVTAFWAMFNTANKHELAVVFSAIALATLILCWRRPGLKRDLWISGAGLALAFSLLASSGRAWSPDRYMTHQLAQTLPQLTNKVRPLATWGVNPAVYVYYVRGRIPWLKSETEIADLVERSRTQSLLLLVPLTRVDLLKKRFNVRLLDSTMELEGDATALILVE